MSCIPLTNMCIDYTSKQDAEDFKIKQTEYYLKKKNL